MVRFGEFCNFGKNFIGTNFIEFKPENVESAKLVIYRFAKRQLLTNFDDTCKRFVKLNPTVASDGIIRSQDRLMKINLPYINKNMVILPGEHPIVILLAKFYHSKLVHQGYRVILNDLMNNGINIGGGSKLLKSVANSCIYCRIRRRKLLGQKITKL